MLLVLELLSDFDICGFNCIDARATRQRNLDCIGIAELANLRAVLLNSELYGQSSLHRLVSIHRECDVVRITIIRDRENFDRRRIRGRRVNAKRLADRNRESARSRRSCCDFTRRSHVLYRRCIATSRNRICNGAVLIAIVSNDRNFVARIDRGNRTRTERINARIAEVKAETERLRREAEQRLEERREIVAEKLEPATLIKSEIISRQDALIGLLYDAQTASEEMKSLKADIDREKERLESRPLSKIMASRKD